jgi:regulatory protein
MTDSAEDEAFEKACGYLSYRQRTEKEMVRYLNKRGYTDVRDEVIARLKRAGLINDRVFAETWIVERAGNRGYGARRLRSELLRLGLNPVLVDDTIASYYPEDKEDVRAADLAARHWPKISGKTPLDRGRKLYAFLIRRGFDSQSAKEAVDLLVRETKASE